MALPASQVPFMGVKFTEQDKSVVLNSEPSLQMPFEDFQATITPCQPGALLWFNVFGEKILIFTSTPKTWISTKLTSLVILHGFMVFTAY